MKISHRHTRYLQTLHRDTLKTHHTHMGTPSQVQLICTACVQHTLQARTLRIHDVHIYLYLYLYTQPGSQTQCTHTRPSAQTSMLSVCMNKYMHGHMYLWELGCDLVLLMTDFLRSRQHNESRGFHLADFLGCERVEGKGALFDRLPFLPGTL